MKVFALLVAMLIPTVAAADTEELKRTYLECERAALDSRLPSSEVAVCSEVYERLLNEVFGGNFAALYDWYQRQQKDRI